MNLFSILIVLCGLFISSNLALTNSNAIQVFRYRNIDQFRVNVLTEFNKMRARNAAPPLSLYEKANRFAQAHVEKVAQSGRFSFSNGPYGENYSWQLRIDSNFDVKTLMKSYEEEEKAYDFNKPGFSRSTGLFTQIVWRATQRVGVGVAVVRQGQFYKIYVVFEFDPPGNILNRFAQNVGNRGTSGEDNLVPVDSNLIPVTAPETTERPTPKPNTGIRPPIDTGMNTNTVFPNKGQFRMNVLAAFNKMRARQGASPLSLAAKPTIFAQTHAERLARTGQLSFSNPRGPYGEMLNMQANMFNGFDIKKMMESYEKQEQAYDFNNPGFSRSTGGFTQIAWRATQRVGVGVAVARESRWYKVYVVFEFDPPGNILGRFAQNVGGRRIESGGDPNLTSAANRPTVTAGHPPRRSVST